MTVRRHVLVVATQCDSMPPLAMLDEAANGLAAVLTDEACGACESGLPDGRALVRGVIGQAEVEQHVRAAVEHAAQRSATLILALLGHGFVPGDQPTLYLMARESVENVPNTAVNVPALLEAAADRVGIRGIIALIDTCNAAGAIPSAPALTSGARRGRTRLDLVMASAVQQPAINFTMSAALAELLRSGLGDAPTLGADDLVPALRSRVRGQSLTLNRYDGQAGELWLGRNPRAAAAASRYGAYGYARYRTAMHDALPGLADLPPVAEALDRLVARPQSPQRARAESVVRNLFAVLPTVDLIRGPLLRDTLTTRSLRQASPVPLPEDLLGSLAPIEAEVVSFLALNPPVTRSGAAQLVRFVLTLADEAGRDLWAPEIRSWIDGLGQTVLGNEIVAELGERRQRRELRLIISLHASLTGDWPEIVKAWVIQGEEDLESRDFPCEATQAGVAEAVLDAVDYAGGVARRQQRPLQQVEVAAPAGLLLCWRPEEIKLGIRLGESHDMVLHWSDRFKQSREMRHMNRWLRERLRAEPPAERPFAWVDDRGRLEIGRLREEVAKHAYGTAVAMGCRPANVEAVLATLLMFTPIVIWPDRETPVGSPCADLEKAWRRLPGAFLEAYRKRWRDEQVPTLADLRAVWDDEIWLEFCSSMQWRHQQEASG